MENCTLADHIIDFRFCSCVNMQFISCFHKVAHHGFSHDANTDKSNFFHSELLYFGLTIFPATAQLAAVFGDAR